MNADDKEDKRRLVTENYCFICVHPEYKPASICGTTLQKENGPVSRPVLHPAQQIFFS
jgi:hypothetical protein